MLLLCFDTGMSCRQSVHFAFSWTYLNNFNIQALHYLLSVVPFSRLDDTQGVTIHHETGKRGGKPQTAVATFIIDMLHPQTQQWVFFIGFT